MGKGFGVFLFLQKYINPSVFENFWGSSNLWVLALISIKICKVNKPHTLTKKFVF